MSQFDWFSWQGKVRGYLLTFAITIAAELAPKLGALSWYAVRLMWISLEISLAHFVKIFT